MPYAEAPDGARLHWERHGSGPPLVLAAGLGGVSNYWTPNLQDFSQHFTTIIFDQRGTGQSTRVPVKSIEEMSADLVAIMDAAEIRRAHVLGHSTGGAIGIATALDHPGRIASLLIYASTTRGDPYRRKLLGLRSRILADLGPEAYATLTSLLLYPPYWINAHPDEVDVIEAATPAGLGAPDIQASRLEAILGFDRRAEFGRLSLPVLVVCAEDDILTPRYFSEEYARLIPGARAHWEPRGGHALSRTEPETFARIALSFFRGLPTP